MSIEQRTTTTKIVNVNLTLSEIKQFVKEHYNEEVPSHASVSVYNQDRHSDPGKNDIIIAFSWTEVEFPTCFCGEPTRLDTVHTPTSCKTSELFAADYALNHKEK